MTKQTAEHDKHAPNASKSPRNNSRNAIHTHRHRYAHRYYYDLIPSRVARVVSSSFVRRRTATRLQHTPRIRRPTLTHPLVVGRQKYGDEVKADVTPRDVM